MPKFYVTVHGCGGSMWEAVDPHFKLLIDFENLEVAEKWAKEVNELLEEAYVYVHDKADVVTPEKAKQLTLSEFEAGPRTLGVLEEWFDRQIKKNEE